MPTDWEEVQKAIYPIKDYVDLCRRWHESFSYPFVRETFNFPLPQLVNYTRLVFGGDSRGRYTEYESMLIQILDELHQARVQDLLDLMVKVRTRERLETFAE
jgi:hypothetical protein